MRSTSSVSVGGEGPLLLLIVLNLLNVALEAWDVYHSPSPITYAECNTACSDQGGRVQVWSVEQCACQYTRR